MHNGIAWRIGQVGRGRAPRNVVGIIINLERFSFEIKKNIALLARLGASYCK